MSRFKPARGGHAPGHLREAFDAGCESFYESESGDIAAAFGSADRLDLYNERQRQEWLAMTDHDRAAWLFGQLWNCTDTMPGGVCEEIESLSISGQPGETSTYGRAARLLKYHLEQAAVAA